MLAFGPFPLPATITHMTPAIHHMKVDAPYFSEIASGKKTAELRLFDGKRQAIRVGDTIIFTKNPDENAETVTTIVTNITLANTFIELLQKIPVGIAGSIDQEPALLRSFYPEELEKRHGVVAIHIKRT